MMAAILAFVKGLLSKTEGEISTLASQMAKAAKYVRIPNPTAKENTYTFDNPYPFIVIVTRGATTSTDGTGLYIGNSGATSGNVLTIFEPTGGTKPTVSISGNTLTVTTVSANSNVVIIYFPTN